jgi:hypothetical protein
VRKSMETMSNMRRVGLGMCNQFDALVLSDGD